MRYHLCRVCKRVFKPRTGRPGAYHHADLCRWCNDARIDLERQYADVVEAARIEREFTAAKADNRRANRFTLSAGDCWRGSTLTAPTQGRTA